MLRRTLRLAPPDMAVALVMLPVWAEILPRSGPELATEHSCRAAFQAFAGSLKRGIFIDRRKADPLTTDPHNFFDRTHYREPIASQVEAELTRALQKLP